MSLPRLLALTAALVALSASASEPAPDGGPRISAARARVLLYPEPSDAGLASLCATGEEPERIACLLRTRLAEDPEAAKLAVSFYQRTGDVVGVLPEQDFEGGYRGTIHLVPQLPVGPERKHLAWTAAALTELDDFFAGIERTAQAPARYRWKALEVRFYRSIKKRTPAAFAEGWTVSYNVNGTLNGSARQVRDLLFHEIFHLNDRAHSDWSVLALSEFYVPTATRCGTAIACLAPYAPDPLIVRGGTYYSFMPGNGVREYAADLALRYSREQRDALAGTPIKAPFKCGPEENGKAWAKLVNEFFAGVDYVPACPQVKGKRKGAPGPN